MSQANLEIHCALGQRRVQVSAERQSLPLSQLLRDAALPLNTRCGERGLCEGCVIELVEGSLVNLLTGLPAHASGHPVALRSCTHRMPGQGPVRIRIPPRAMLAYEPQILTDYRLNVPRAHHPLLQVIPVEPLSAPGEEALCRAVASQLDTPLPVRMAPEAAAQLRVLSGQRLYATVALQEGHWLMTGLSDRIDRPLLGAAIDIGTTTVVVALVDLADGKVLGRAAAFNQQMLLGDDVVTRITLCLNDPKQVEQLQEAVNHRTLAPLLAEAARQAGVSVEQIACLSVAGNTTMQHLAAGVNPASMGIAPFTPAFVHHRTLGAPAVFHQQTAQACSSSATVHLLPSAGAYVGADLCAGVVASGLLYDEGPSLLVDVGTNGEVILKHQGRLLGCATAAGPAFEGAGLSCGIRAGEGAISRIALADAPFALSVQCIGSKETIPTGLCGSAYIDFLAESRRIGLVGATGRFNGEAIPEARSRLMPWAGTDLAFCVDGGAGRQPIVISQRDIASLLQAKAAIAAGILMLLRRAGLEAGEIKRLYLAGGFGTHLAARHAIGCGLLPGFSERQIQTVGNTSLGGAYLALLDSSVLKELSRIGQRLEVIELNLEPGFEDCYIDQLALPEP